MICLGQVRQVADNPGRVLALTIPVAFFAAIDGTTDDGVEGVIGPSDSLRADFLGISRGFAVILLVMCVPPFSKKATRVVTSPCSYIGSRFYLHDPPGKNNVFSPRPDIPPELLAREKALEEAEPDVNPWACIILLVACVAFVGVTAEFVRHHHLAILHADVLTTTFSQLVESIDYVREKGNIKEECVFYSGISPCIYS